MNSQENNKKKKLTSPVRKEKLEEGQKVLDLVSNESMLEQLVELFNYRTTPDAGFSIRELAMLFFPQHVRNDPKTGNQIPTKEGIDNIYALLHMFRKSHLNKSLVLYTAQVKNEELSNDEKDVYESLVYRMMTYADFLPKKKRLLEIIDGIQESIENAIMIVTKPREELERLDEELRKALEENRYKRKRVSQSN